MADQPGDHPPEPPVYTTTIIEKRGGGGLLILAIIALALVLAIGFFLMSSHRSQDTQADAVVGAAHAIDTAATKVGDAAARTAEKFDKKH